MRYTDRTIESLEQDYKKDKPLKWIRRSKRIAVAFLLLCVIGMALGDPIKGVIGSGLNLALVMGLSQMQERRQRKIRGKYLI